MKAVLSLCTIFIIGFVHGGVVVPATTTLVRTPSLDSSIVKSERVGDNFAYSTLESHGYTAVAPVALTYTAQYATAPITLPIYSQSIFAGQPLFTPSVINSPLLAGLFGQAPISIAGQAPVQAPAQTPAATPPAPSPVAAQGETPAPAGAVVDDDTVSVESAA